MLTWPRDRSLARSARAFSTSISTGALVDHMMYICPCTEMCGTVALMNTLPYPLSHPLTDSLNNPPIYPLTHPLTNSLTHTFTRSLAHSLTHVRMHVRTHVRTHAYMNARTHTHFPGTLIFINAVAFETQVTWTALFLTKDARSSKKENSIEWNKNDRAPFNKEWNRKVKCIMLFPWRKRNILIICVNLDSHPAQFY